MGSSGKHVLVDTNRLFLSLLVIGGETILNSDLMPFILLYISFLLPRTSLIWEIKPALYLFVSSFCVVCTAVGRTLVS